MKLKADSLSDILQRLLSSIT